MNIYKIKLKIWTKIIKILLKNNKNNTLILLMIKKFKSKILFLIMIFKKDKLNKKIIFNLSINHYNMIKILIKNKNKIKIKKR